MVLKPVFTFTQFFFSPDETPPVYPRIIFRAFVMIFFELFLIVTIAFLFLKIFFFLFWLWIILKIFIGFVTRWLLFCILFFWREAWGILAPEPGIKLAPSTLEGKVLSIGPPGKPLDWTLECGRWTGQASSRGLVGPSGDAPLAPFRHSSRTSLWVLQGPRDAILLPRPEPRRLEITSCSPKTTAGSSFPPHTRP